MTDGIPRIEPLLRVTTAQLLQVAENGRVAGFERTFNPELAHFLAPEGRHILRSRAFLDQVAGKAVPAFVRAEASVTLFGTRDPAVVPLDVRLRDWMALPVAPPVSSAGVEDEVRINMQFKLDDLRPDERTPAL